MGGAVGLSIFATLLSNHRTVAPAGLAQQLGATRPEVTQLLGRVEHGLVAGGLDTLNSRAAALRVVDGTVALQAMVLSFDWVFIFAGVLFLAVIPLVWFLKSGPSGSPAAGHVEV